MNCNGAYPLSQASCVFTQKNTMGVNEVQVLHKICKAGTTRCPTLLVWNLLSSDLAWRLKEESLTSFLIMPNVHIPPP